MEIGAVFVRDLAQPREDRRVVFGTEHHRVYFVGRKFVARYFMREKRVARVNVTLLKPFEQPGRKILHGIRALRPC